MKLSTWAREQGLTYRTAYRLFHAGKLPVPAEQLATGTILVHPPKPAGPSYVAIYARVSGHDQKADLDRQVSRLVEFATSRGLLVAEVIKETGSGLNGHRAGLLQLLKDPATSLILVEHRDRLTRFGFEYIEAALAAQGRKILVADTTELNDDVVQDLHDIIVSMCARLYGKRAAHNKAQRALEALR